MKTSEVYFTNLRTTPGNDMMTKLTRLVRRAGIENIDFKDKFTAIKIHFGEPGTGRKSISDGQQYPLFRRKVKCS